MQAHRFDLIWLGTDLINLNTNYWVSRGIIRIISIVLYIIVLFLHFYQQSYSWPNMSKIYNLIGWIFVNGISLADAESTSLSA